MAVAKKKANSKLKTLKGKPSRLMMPRGFAKDDLPNVSQAKWVKKMKALRAKKR